MKDKLVTLILLTTVVLSGCSAAKEGDPSTDTQVTELTETTASATTSETAATVPETSETTTVTTAQEKFEFNPHVHVKIMDKWTSPDYWDSFYNLCDALREGRDTFECSSKEAYEWCLDDVTMGSLFPAASMTVCGKSDDGSVPFEDGIGRIYYKVPPEEVVARQKDFEGVIEDIINTYVDKDDNDFEKCIKLYNYVESNYTYGELELSDTEGYFYKCIMEKKGICSDISAAYAYLLMQVEVDAISVGCFDNMDHAWTYLVIDGQGYHSDPTWALQSGTYMEHLDLDYFLMTDEERTESGCPVTDLTVGLYPAFWIKDTDIELSAASTKYEALGHAVLDRLDEENKIIYFWEADEPKEFCYK